MKGDRIVRGNTVYTYDEYKYEAPLLMMKKFVLLLFVLNSSIPCFAQWTQCNGPYGGNIKCMAESDVTNTLFAGCFQGGIFRYKNGSTKWESLYDRLPESIIYEIGISDSLIFAATHNGLYKTSDDGDTWISSFQDDTSEIQPNNNIMTNVVCADSLVIVGETSKIFISTDRGITYNEISHNIPDTATSVKDLAIFGGRIFALYSTPALNATISFSDDHGSTWQKPSINIPAPGWWYRFRSFSGNIYALGSSSIYVSSDNGDHWNTISLSGIPLWSGFKDIYISNDTILLGTVYSGVYISIDSGVTFNKSNNGLPLTDILTTQLLKANSTELLLATHLGIFRTTDTGLSWDDSKNNIIASRVNGITECNNELFVSTNMFGIYATSDNGITWSSRSNGLENSNYLSSAPPIIAAGNRLLFSGKYYSDDFGNSWLPWNSGFYALFDFLKYQNIVYAGTDYGIYYSSDSANTWTRIVNGPVHSASAFIVKDSIIISEDEHHSSFPPYYTTYLKRSDDNGATFSIMDSTYTISDIEIIDSSVIAATNSIFLYRSDDLGLTWYLDSTLGYTGISDIYVVDSKYVFIGTGEGKIYLSKDTGVTWIDMTSNYLGLGARFYHFGKYLFVASGISGVWKKDISYLLPNSVDSLGQNYLIIYPNPTNGNFTLNIPSDLRNNTILVLQIYDNVGKLVKQFSIDSGQAEFNFSLKNESLGMYYLTLSGDSKKYISKIVSTH